MKVHTDHFEASDNAKNHVIVVSENEETDQSGNDWDIYLFASPKSHLQYYNEHIHGEHEDPRVIEAGDLLPQNVLPDSPHSILLNAGSTDNAGLTENGLGIPEDQFMRWKEAIENAINRRIAWIKDKYKEDKAKAQKSDSIPVPA